MLEEWRCKAEEEATVTASRSIHTETSWLAAAYQAVRRPASSTVDGGVLEVSVKMPPESAARTVMFRERIAVSATASPGATRALVAARLAAWEIQLAPKNADEIVKAASELNTTRCTVVEKAIISEFDDGWKKALVRPGTPALLPAVGVYTSAGELIRYKPAPGNGEEAMSPEMTEFLTDEHVRNFTARVTGRKLEVHVGPSIHARIENILGPLDWLNLFRPMVPNLRLGIEARTP